MDSTRSNIAHLLRRAGFGARPDEIDRAVTAGYLATVDSLLAGLSASDPAGEAVAVPAFTSGSAKAAAASDPAARKAADQARAVQQRQELQALQQWWLNRMIVTATPLREKLALIWHGHFATGVVKVRDAGLMHRQNQLFRTLGGGGFEALTQALAKDPAMMVWLDTRTDVAGHPNENFARELMELFTLGIGNFTENDVQEAARAFTGWTFVASTGDFVLRPGRHDNGIKSFLGQTGNFDGTDIIGLVTHLPASARFVVAKLWSHLAYPVTAADAIVSELASGYAKDLEITALLRRIFLHPAFTSDSAKQGLIKQPIEWAVGAARSLGLSANLQPVAAGAGPSPTAMPLYGVLIRLAQEPFNPPSVGGWPQNGYWLNTATSLTRLQVGLAMGRRLDLAWLSGLAVSQRPDAVAAHLSIDGWGQTTAAALNHVAADPAVLVGLALSSPEYILN